MFFLFLSVVICFVYSIVILYLNKHNIVVLAWLLDHCVR